MDEKVDYFTLSPVFDVNPIKVDALRYWLKESIKRRLYFEKKGKKLKMNIRSDTENLRRGILYWLLEETKLVDEQGNIYITMAPKEFRRSFHQLRFGKTRRTRLRNLKRCLKMFKVDEDGDIIVLP